MRLDFNVLWVDDQPDRVQAQIAAIARHMEEDGFQFSATLCKSMDEVRQRISGDVFTDEVDLILVDWDLGGGVQGQDAIAEVRDQIPYKDVVFYSAMKAADELRQLAFESGLEGIYCATRAELVAEVIGVFDSLVKKVLDLDHARGIVMGATSDIDYMVHECLAAIHEQLDEAGRQELLKESLKRINDRIDDLVTRAAKLQKETSMAALFEAHMVFTANDRLRILKRVLEKKTFEAHEGGRAAVATYIQTVVPERNIMGHLVLVPEGKPQAVIGNKGTPMTLDQTRELRRAILGLRGDFRTLLAALQKKT
jgi:hypothetical protein